jgi:hypothetical protein
MAFRFIGGGNVVPQAPFKVDMKAKRLSWFIRVCWKFEDEKLERKHSYLTSR